MNTIFIIYVAISIIFAIILEWALVIRWQEVQKPTEQRRPEVLQRAKRNISFAISFLFVCFIVILLHFLGH